MIFLRDGNLYNLDLDIPFICVKQDMSNGKFYQLLIDQATNDVYSEEVPSQEEKRFVLTDTDTNAIKEIAFYDGALLLINLTTGQTCDLSEVLNLLNQIKNCSCGAQTNKPFKMVPID